MREGLFNDDDMKQLEAGYSVSDTEDELSAINDILSAHSYYQSKAPYLKNADGVRSMIASSPVMEEGDLDPAQAARFQQFNGALLSEISSQKHKFAKKYQILERQNEQLRMEKQ